MSYNPRTDEDIRIVFDSDQGGFVIDQVYVRRDLGSGRIDQAIDREFLPIGGEYWETMTPPLSLLDVIYQAYALIWHENRRIRSLDLGPFSPNGPEVDRVRTILDNVRF